MNKRADGKIYYAITFFMSLIYRMMQIAGDFQMRISADDIGMLASPAYLAGYDWSNAVGTTNYYGIAYYILFTPVLKFVKEPCTIWAILIFANGVLVSLACVLSYHVAVKYMQFRGGFLTSVAAVLSATVIISSNCMSQEAALFFLTWLATFVLAKMTDKNRKKLQICLYSLALVMICMYAYLVHSRAIVLVVGLTIAFVIYVCHDIKKMKYLLFFISTMILGLVFATTLRDYIISVLWSQKETSLENVSIVVGSNTIKVLFTPVGMRVLIDMFISNLFTAVGKTLGLNIIAIAMAGLIIAGLKIRKCAIQISLIKKIIFIFSLSCYLIGLIGVCVVWGKSVVGVYFTEEVVYQYKGFSYFRYSATFLGPAAMVALTECIQNIVVRRKMKWLVFISELLVIWYYLLFIVPKMENSEYLNNAIVSYFKVKTEGFDWINCQMTILVIMLSTYIIFFESKKLLYKGIMLSICLLCNLIPYMGKGFIAKPQLHSQADAGYYLIEFLENTDCFPNKIYCPSSIRIRYYQYHLKEYSVIFGYPNENNKEILLLNSGKKNENIPDGFIQVQLDGDEWIWTDDEELYEIVVNYVKQKNE